MTLPNDVARCENSTCSRRESCRRTEPIRGDRGVYAEFPGGPDCAYYMPTPTEPKEPQRG